MAENTRRWDELLERLNQLEKSGEFSSTDHLDIVKRLGGLRLIQPFNWNSWGADIIPLAELDQLDIHDCVRHITRIVRADRFSEGVLAGAVSSGYLLTLCEVARSRVVDSPVPALPRTA